MDTLKQYTLGRLGKTAENIHDTAANVVDEGGWDTGYMLYQAKEGAKALLGKRLEHNIPDSLDVAGLCRTVEAFKPKKIGQAAKTSTLRAMGRVTKNTTIPNTSIRPRNFRGRFTKRNIQAPNIESRPRNFRGRFTKRNNSQVPTLSFKNFIGAT